MSDLFDVRANRLNLRAAPGVEARVLDIIAKGEQVERLDTASPDNWWRVRRARTNQTGYVARRYLSPHLSVAPAAPADFNEVLWRATETAIADKVSYLLGARRSASGAIDCSGWVDEITSKAFDAMNLAARPDIVFDRRDYSALDNHSDGIITGIERRTGFVLHGADVIAERLHEGMLIGGNFGVYRWEVSDPPRVYGIDHIVQVMRDPETGVLFITQSSHAGRGVNKVALDAWLPYCAGLGLMRDKKIHAVDPFLMADRATDFVRTIASLPPVLTTTAAPSEPKALAGPVGETLAPNLPSAFKGRGAYIYSGKGVIATYGSIAAAVREMTRCKLNHIWVRIHGLDYIGDTRGADKAALKTLIKAARDANIEVAGWGWCQGADVVQESKLAKSALDTFGLTAYVADIEQGVGGAKWTAAEVTSFFESVKQHPDIKICLTSHGFIDWHDPGILKGLDALIDCVNPQAYWYGSSPNQKMRNEAPNGADYALANAASYAHLCFDRWSALYRKPVILAGQAYAEGDFLVADAEAKLEQFLTDFKPDPALLGVNYWHWGAMSRNMRDLLARTP